MKHPLLALSLLLAAAAHAVPPANDDFANAQLLTGKSGSVSLNISQATEEPDEFLGGLETTVWYRVSVPAGKTVIIDSFGSDFDTVLEAGPADAVSNFFSHFHNNNAANTLQSRVLIRGFQSAGSEISHVRARGDFGATGELRLNYRVFDGPIFELNGAAIFAVREGAVAEVEIYRDGKANVAASVQVVLGDLSAVAGEDYLGLPVTVSFASGETFKTARVPIYADGDNEGPENLHVRLVSPSLNAVVGNGEAGEIVIDDAQDDPANDNFVDAEVLPGLTGTATGDTTGAGNEAGENFEAVGVNTFQAYTRTAWYCWTPGTSGLAELRMSNGNLVLGVGTGPTLATLSPATRQAESYDSATDEAQLFIPVTAGETYWIMVAAPYYSQGGPFTLKYTLLDAGAIELVPGQTFREDAGTITVALRRVGGSDGSVTVDYETAAPNGFPPEADPSSDYAAASGTLTFADGQTERTFTIALTADSDAEGTEFLPIILSAPTGGAVLLAAERSIFVDEEEDDPANDAFASATAIAGAEGEVAGDNTGAGIEADEPVGLRETVWYSWVAPSAGFVEFFNGDGNSQFISVHRGATLASLVEASSGFYSTDTIGVAVGETLHIAVSSASDEGFPAGPFVLEWEHSTGSRFHFSAETNALNEADGSATIRIERDGPTLKAASVRLKTRSYFIGTGNATPGADYKHTVMKVTIPAGATFKEVQIPIFNDNQDEGTEAIGISLDDASDGSVRGHPSFAKIEVSDSVDYAPQKGTFFGLITSPTDALAESGYFTAATDAKGMLTGKLFLGGKAYSFKGPVTAAGSVLISIPRKGTPAPPPLSLALQLGDGIETLTGTLTVDGETLAVSAHRSTATKSAPAALAGRYTALLRTGGAAGSPDAPGYALITVAPASGLVKVVGALADGTKFTWGTVLAPDGTIPVSILMYKLQGILHGQLQLGDYSPERDGSGSLHWIHPVQTKGQFLTAFESDLTVDISAYQFAKGTRALPLPDPGDTVLDLFDTAAAVSLSKNIRIDSKSAITVIAPSTNTEKVTAKIATATGLLSGNWKHTDGKTIPFTGVLYQRTLSAGGYFLGATVNGTAEIAP